MEPAQHCPECGAPWPEEHTCQDDFHQMLFWETEYPGYGEVHHLMVLCYHLQHPSLYSPQGLRFAIKLLEDFLKRGLTPQQTRQRARPAVDSGTRTWKITGTPASHGSYDAPIQWPMIAAHVIANGSDHYCASVRTWARSIYDTLKAAGKLSSE